MDWDAWAERFERGGGADALQAFFAPGGTFQDPVTPPTTDVRAVAEHTEQLFPDWHQRVDSIRGGDGWAVFEWTGSGTYLGPGAEEGPGIAVTIEGATVVTVDDDGLVTSWRDYLDTAAPANQILAGLEALGPSSGGGPHDHAEMVADWQARLVDEQPG